MVVAPVLMTVAVALAFSTPVTATVLPFNVALTMAGAVFGLLAGFDALMNALPKPKATSS